MQEHVRYAEAIRQRQGGGGPMGYSGLKLGYDASEGVARGGCGPEDDA